MFEFVHYGLHVIVRQDFDPYRGVMLLRFLLEAGGMCRL